MKKDGHKIKCSDIPEKEILNCCYNVYHNNGETPDIALGDKYPIKVIMTKMEKMVDKGLLDCGVSLRTSWVTEKGMELI